MSKKGGGSISGRGGGASSNNDTARNMTGTGGGGGGRESHFKVLATDAKYGMLMWQSKLQDKFLKEEKEKKQKEQLSSSSTRRKSNEDYSQSQQQTRFQFHQAQTHHNRTLPLRGGSSSSRQNYSKNNNNGIKQTQNSYLNSKVNFRNETPNEFRIEIEKEKETEKRVGYDDATTNTNPTPTPFVATSHQTRGGDLSEKFVSYTSDNNEPVVSGTTSNNNHNSFAPSKYLGDIQTQTVVNPGDDDDDNNGAYSESSGGIGVKYKETLSNPEGMRYNNSRQYYNEEEQRVNAYHHPRSNHYQKQFHHQRERDFINPAIPNTATLPRLVTSRGENNTMMRNNNSQMPKLSNSVSYNNLIPPPAGLATPYNFTSNLEFFGLMGFGDGGFGSNGGAGAPRRSGSGRLITNLQGHPDIRYHQKDTRGFEQTIRYMMDKDRIKNYKEDLDKQVLEKERQAVARGRGSMSIPIKIMSSHESVQMQNLTGDLTSHYPGNSNGSGRKNSSKNSGMELAPLIRKYKSLPKLNTLNSTDVTKQFVASPRRGDYCLSPEPEEIAKSLSLQLAEKQRNHQITQENDRIAAEKHFNTWDSFWGRPGCGAPMFYYKNPGIGASNPSLATSRTDLFRALHMTHENRPK